MVAIDTNFIKTSNIHEFVALFFSSFYFRVIVRGSSRVRCESPMCVWKVDVSERKLDGLVEVSGQENLKNF